MKRKLPENPEKIQVIYINSKTEPLLKEWHILLGNQDYLGEEELDELYEYNAMFDGKAHIYSEQQLSPAEELEYKKEKAIENRLQNSVFNDNDWALTEMI